MAIRKLNVEEIKKISEKIEELKYEDFYKYYFNGTTPNFPKEAYLIDDSYYVDFTYYENLIWLGVINLEKKASRTIYYELTELIKEKIKVYKKIYQWCNCKNDVAFRFHKLLLKKFNSKQFFKNGYSILEIKEE